MKLCERNKEYPYYVVIYKGDRYVAEGLVEFDCMLQGVMGECWYT